MNKLYRIEREEDLSYVDQWFLKPGEWAHDPEGKTKESDPAWITRYNHERDILLPIIDDLKINKVIEMGSGPGYLSNLVLEERPTLEYHLVDKVGAQTAFEFREYKGVFHLKDLNLDFDITEIPTDFDMLIANDFFEHIQSPSSVLMKCRDILKENGYAFISVPNWRNGHDFIYRGLFDFDNFVFMMKTHGFELMAAGDSPLKTSPIAKLDSEKTMPDELLNSWNWYFLFKKVEK